MSELKYTPGPWYIHDETCWDKIYERYVGTFDIRTNPEGIPGKDSLWIADVKPYEMNGFTGRETAIANAKLIAASPDLLEALQEAQNALKENYPWPELHEKIQVAIDKATK